MIRLLQVFAFLLLAGTVFSQEQDYADGEENDSLSVRLLPFPVNGGWTFTPVRPNDSLVFPVYDSIVVRPWEMETWKPFVAISDGRYGVLYYTGKLDTLKPFIYDSLFYCGTSIYGRSNGSWSQLGFSEDGAKISDVVIGAADRWYEDGAFLYYTAGGKTGLFDMTYGNHIPARYRYVRWAFTSGLHARDGMDDRYVLKPFYLISDGVSFGLSDGEKEIVPVVAETVQQFGDGFCRYWQGYWKYVSLHTGKLIDPKGGDVVVYNRETWKVYQPGRTKPTLHVDSGSRSFSGAYDNYFPLSNQMIAVRRDTLVGLMDRSGNLQFDCRCEQLDAVSNDRYRCLRNKKWYLMDGNGKTLSANGYDFITDAIYGSDLFEVHFNNQRGMLDRSGKQLLKPVYDEIIVYDNLFVVGYNSKFAVANFNGDIFSEHDYSFFKWWNDMLVMSPNNRDFTIYSSAGKLNLVPCGQYFYVDGVLKCYSQRMLEMVVVDERLKVLERLNYPGVYSFEVDKFEEFAIKDHIRQGRILSHLEEHQQSGLFGYRHDWKQGHVKKPSFLEVHRGGSFGFDFGVEEYAPERFAIDERLSLKSYYTLQAVDAGEARYAGSAFTSSTLRDDAPGWSTSWNRMSWFTNGGREWWGGNHRDPAGAVVYIDYPSNSVYRYNVGGEIVAAGRERGSFSAFDYYMRFNNWQNLVPEPGAIAYVMDPSSRLKVEGGLWFVDHDDIHPSEKMRKEIQGRDYEDISFHSDVDYKLSTYFGRTSAQSNYEWSFQYNDSIVLRSFRAIEGDEAHYNIVTDAAMRTGLVDPFNPAFLFVPGDPDLQYAGGRIIFKENTLFGLRTIDGQELIPAASDELIYMGNGLFGVKKGTEWRIADRSGKSDGSIYDALDVFRNGFALVVDGGVSKVIDTALRVVFESPGIIFASGNGTFAVQLPNGKLLVDPARAITDTVFTHEKDLGNGWIFGQVNEKRYVRRIGGREKIPVQAAVIPEAFGGSLIWKEKGAYRMIGPDGAPVVTKKMALNGIEKEEGISCFKSTKKWVFVSDAGSVLLEMPKGKNLSWYDRKFIVEQADSVFGIDRFGNRYAMTAQGAVSVGKTSSEAQISAEYIVFSESGKQGVRSPSGKLLVSPAYPSVLGKEGEQFIVEIAPGKGVYTHAIKEVVPPVYDEVIPLNAAYFLLRTGRSYGIYSISGSWVRPPEVR